MRNELNCLDYYSSGFKPSSFSHSKKESIRQNINININIKKK